MTETTEINWGYNCLTSGIHHGRPETIWNIPLVYAATTIFHRPYVKDLVIARIHNDAMQFVEHGVALRQKETDAVWKLDQEWADRVKARAEERYDTVVKDTIDEITRYYESPGWQLEQQEAIRRVQENKLNPGYQPLHPYDSINMLCRIIGVSASASSE